MGVYSLNNCFPIREVLIADYEEMNSTISYDFYDVVLGVDPSDFIPPNECNQASWAKPTSKAPYF